MHNEVGDPAVVRCCIGDNVKLATGVAGLFKGQVLQGWLRSDEAGQNFYRGLGWPQDDQSGWGEPQVGFESAVARVYREGYARVLLFAQASCLATGLHHKGRREPDANEIHAVTVRVNVGCVEYFIGQEMAPNFKPELCWQAAKGRKGGHGGLGYDDGEMIWHS